MTPILLLRNFSMTLFFSSPLTNEKLQKTEDFYCFHSHFMNSKSTIHFHLITFIYSLIHFVMYHFSNIRQLIRASNKNGEIGKKNYLLNFLGSGLFMF